MIISGFKPEVINDVPGDQKYPLTNDTSKKLPLLKHMRCTLRAT
jgi:hypothetical protein